MDPRIGLDWLLEGTDGNVGQFNFRVPLPSRYSRIPAGRFARPQHSPRRATLYWGEPTQRSPFSQFAVQAYELRGGPSFAGPTQWQRVISYIFAREDVARYHFDQTCAEFRAAGSDFRTLVKLFGLRPGAESWDVLAECDVPRLQGNQNPISIWNPIRLF